MRNEKLVPMTLPDPRLRIPYLPQPNGDNKLTAAMVPYYTGNSNTTLFLYTLKASLRISFVISMPSLAFSIVLPLF